MIGVTMPIVKHSYLITDINDIPRIVKEAFYIAESGRPGPVVIDLPKNLQQAKAQLERSSPNFVGVVLNQLDMRHADPLLHYYGAYQH